MKRSLILIFLGVIACFNQTKGQTNFRSGFIISNAKDTIFGEVDYRSDNRMCSVCNFKSENGIKKQFHPGEICGYGFINGRYFISDTLDGKPRFLEFLIKGELKVYYYSDKNSNRYFIKKDINKLNELNYFEKETYMDEFGNSNDGKIYIPTDENSKNRYIARGDYIIKSLEFKEILKNSLSDVPETLSIISSMNKPNHKDLVNLAITYHQHKFNDEEFKVYADLKSESDYILSMGLLNINYRSTDSDKINLLFSFRGYIPLSYRKLYIGYGLQYASIEYKLSHYPYNNESAKIVRIPISFRYQYPGNIIKPNASIGLNVYYTNDTGFIYDFIPSYLIGVAIKFYKAINISFSLEGDFLWNSNYNPSSSGSFSNSKNIGLMIRF